MHLTANWVIRDGGIDPGGRFVADWNVTAGSASLTLYHVGIPLAGMFYPP